MKMSEWLQQSTAAQRAMVARKAETRISYLYQIGGGHRLPSPALALRLEKATNGEVTLADMRPDIDSIWRCRRAQNLPAKEKRPRGRPKKAG